MQRMRRVAAWKPERLLALMIATYFVVSLLASLLWLLEFRASNWDLGIFQQSLWSANHGHFFFEAGDYEAYGIASFLGIHPALIMFALAGLYALWPTPYLLFVVQSAVVAAAAYPLYLLAAQVTGSTRRALLVAGIYMVWVPVLSSGLYDFHLESLLPLEMLSLFYFWYRGRYLYGAIAAAVAMITIEAAPILVFFVAAYFFLPPLRETIARLLAPPSSLPGRARPSFGTRIRAFWSHHMESRAVRLSLGLMIASVVAYVALRGFQEYAISIAVEPPAGIAPVVSPGAPLLWLGLSPSYFSIDLLGKFEYWLLLYALLGFLPLRAPRTFVLVLPWTVQTFFTNNPAFTQIGFQYGFVAVAPLMVAFVFGIRDVKFSSLRDTLHALWHGDVGFVSPDDRRPGIVHGPSAHALRATTVLVLVVVANIAFSPLDPLMQTNGGASLGQAYFLSYHVPSGYADVQEVAGLVPSNAYVLSADDLFPFVSNDVNAYSSLWYTAGVRLPFNDTNLPEYVLISLADAPVMPPFLFPYLYNQSVYGERATVGSTPVGPVILFEKGYAGPVKSLSPVIFHRTDYYGFKLAVGAGMVQKNPNATYNESINSVPSPLQAGSPPSVFWYGPYVNLPAGTYSVTVSLHANVTKGVNASSLVVWIDSSGLFTRIWYSNMNVSLGMLDAPGWHKVTFRFTLPSFTYNVEVRGYILDPSVALMLNYVEIAPA